MALKECLIAWQDDKSTWHALAFDSVQIEAHEGDNIVTSYPVSKGFKVSDHTIRQNAIIRLDAVVSNVSLPVATIRQNYEEAFASLTAAATNGGYADGAATLSSAQLHGRVAHESFFVAGPVSLDKVDEAFETIVQLNRLGTRVHIQTMRRSYFNCVLRHYDTQSDVNSAYALPINLRFEELITLGESNKGDNVVPLSDANGGGLFDGMISALGLG